MMVLRRDVLRIGLAAVTLPVVEGRALAWSELTSAASFMNGGFKGFAIDTVRSRGADSRYFDALARTGANIARIFFPFRKCSDCNEYGRAKGDMDALWRVLDWALERNLRIVVVGDFSDVDKAYFWGHAELRNSVIESWSWLARTVKNHPAIAGLDLVNEPNPPWPSGRVADGHALWQPLAERAIDAIRAEGVTLPIIYEGLGGGQAIGLRDLVPFKDREVVYSVHVYTPHDITHQLVNPAWPRVIPYPAGPEWQLKDSVVGPGGWDRSRLETALRDVTTFQQRHKVPVLVGEFSCVRWAPDRSALRYVADCVAIFRQYGWSWCYHEFRGWPGWDAEVSSEDRQVTKRSEDAPLMKMIRSAFGAP